MSKSKEILEVTSLQSYFFQNLTELNNKSICPIPEEIIYYSSSVMEYYGLSSKFFEFQNGRAQSKILGTKLLEAQLKDRTEQKRIYKDIGDSALMVCGYFSKSIDKKILDLNYYIKIGQLAYLRLNNLSPELLNIPRFYKVMATCFVNTTKLISILSTVNNEDFYQKLLSEDFDETTLKLLGITKSDSKN